MRTADPPLSAATAAGVEPMLPTARSSRFKITFPLTHVWRRFHRVIIKFHRFCCLSVSYPHPLSCFVLAMLVYLTISYSSLYLFTYVTYTRRRWRCTK
ncbi:uncharacterized protein BT62DRAFT_229368 [Guyanagaster necrorhizus]|uniref:Uncharacterized protein n=1 Tax=Guyanagaster necrorhizus TaxID=856835 RepID=A0A9P8ASG0_9AGAR|nr:uncharacterized protein BT62DRAFT_229368 [Guyanagaster necrorhizus MCA 3950]KAG7444832.1 hypothetical protein BT62DRAFT_229368 [Guyanagaster necrorhizus MCA 3950]